MIGLFDRRQNALVHQFHRRGNDAGRDDLADGVAGVVHRVEDRPHRAVVLRIGRQPDPDLGDDAQRAFAADQQAGQIEAGRVVDRAELHDRAVAQHDLDAEHVIDRHAVLERVRSAGVRGHVAADRAGALARRVGGEVIAGAGQRLGEPQVGHARLDHRHAIAEVDLENLVHAREHDHHAAADRQAAAGQARARPARDRPARHACWHSLTTSATCRVDRGKTTAVGRLTLDREGVAIVDRQLRRRREHVLAAQCGAEIGDQWRHVRSW